MIYKIFPSVVLQFSSILSYSFLWTYDIMEAVSLSVTNNTTMNGSDTPISTYMWTTLLRV